MSIRQLRTVQDFDEVLKESAARPVFLLKHSTRCPISARAYEEFQRYAGQAARAGEAVFALVRVIEERALSNEIAARLGVTHQSPQVLLLCGGRAVWNASHQGVHRAAMEAARGRCEARPR